MNENQTQATDRKGSADAVGSPKLGKTYRLRHDRFGVATVQVIGLYDEWINVVVQSGTLRGMGRGAVWGPGDEKTVRASHCHFSEND